MYFKDIRPKTRRKRKEERQELEEGKKASVPCLAQHPSLELKRKNPASSGPSGPWDSSPKKKKVCAFVSFLCSLSLSFNETRSNRASLAERRGLTLTNTIPGGAFFFFFWSLFAVDYLEIQQGRCVASYPAQFGVFQGQTHGHAVRLGLDVPQGLSGLLECSCLSWRALLLPSHQVPASGPSHSHYSQGEGFQTWCKTVSELSIFL